MASTAATTVFLISTTTAAAMVVTPISTTSAAATFSVTIAITISMHPIVGERYKCKDCVEEIGFDLCEGCYKNSPKLPGRFNQQHTPEHQFVIVRPPISRRFSLRFEAVPPEQHDSGSLDSTEEVAIVANLSNDASPDEVDEAASLNLSPDALQDIGNAIASSVTLNNPSEDQEGTDSET
ncbi:unnamed protein product [Fraxinus pennsylvanica]|uniref:ZZ-type domain-containing protein n=1 Tax=Fraxinus pennsylvanica TaxID=56036 RepID=A0AAD2DT22_9LAMI|nr:unnamed protein product [Fraxinus pennsylvanica]